MPKPIIGRDEELAAIDAFVRSAAEAPCGMVVVGEPGIGKTVVWEACVDRARAAGRRVLVHRSVQAEAGFAFAGLGDLAAPVLEEVAGGLAPPRRQALEVALLLADPDGRPTDPRAIGLAFLDVLRELARRDPGVIVALDDIQWLDVSSARVLGVAMRRLQDERVGVIATLRDAPDSIAPFPLEHSLDDGGFQRFALRPLGMGAVHRLLRERLELELARPQLARIHELSAGNPFYALELASTGAPIALDQTIGVPDRLRELLGSRLERLPADTAGVLLAAAACARPTTDLLASACGDTAGALDALHVAARDHVVVLEGTRVRFAHPLLASLCYEQALPSERAAAHRRLAAVVVDPEERARHLALAEDEPDERVAMELDAAAAHAEKRGATAAAADLAHVALDRTPADDREARHRRMLEAARLCRFAGDFRRASVLYEQLRDELEPGPNRARVVYAVASIATLDLPQRIALCEQALTEAGNDVACRAQVLGFLGHCRWLLGELPAAVRESRAAVRLAERAGDHRVEASALARAACVETFALDTTPGLLERALAAEGTIDRPVAWHENPTYMLTVTLMHQRDELDRARAMLEKVEAVATDCGDEDTRPWAVMQRIILEWQTGHWRQALVHAAAARELGEQTGNAYYQVMVARFTAPVEAGLGHVDEARTTAGDGIRLASAIANERMLIGNLAALGQLELALGDYERADGYLRELPARLLRSGHRNPVNGPWADAIETLIALGDLDEARARLDVYRDLAGRANGWARIGAERCAGLLAVATGNARGAVTLLEQALATDVAAIYPFERARTLLALGGARRRARQSRLAREALEQALAVFDELEAPLWAAKAEAELKRISGRRAASATLTEAERRVATLAVEGRHNKEIATDLFLSVSTVEAYLSRVYRKLGVRSRTELARRFPPGSDTG